MGGTFTDAVVSAPHGVFTGKTPTTPGDQSDGVLAAAAEALAAADLEATAVDEFIHGMTVTTNALLEGRFARTALIATKGFTDLEELGRQNRADLYRLGAARPAPIVPAELRFSLDERCGPDGVVEPLGQAEAEAVAEQVLAAGAQSVAVCLLFSFRYPQHELIVREALRARAPQLHVSLSHEAVGTFREYERCATTVADAALAPLLAGYLSRLTARAGETGLPEPQVMLSSGGTVPARVAAANASWTVLSGPAGGAVGAARAAAAHGRALAFDMGGTSTDISTSTGGEIAVSAAREIAGRPIALPAVDVITVGAGGGSIAWCDDGGALRVGPQSAGARPGPACYGYGGREATVTDANLLLGYLAEDSTLAGGLRLDRDAAERALGELGARLGLSAPETAAGVVRIANLEMLRQATAATVARGLDPREYTLVAFGGAGPMHAAAIAEALEIRHVLCPAACGVLSAWGMTVSGSRRDRSAGVVRRLDQLSAGEIAEIERELAAASADELGIELAQAVATTTYDLRYAGQAFELPVEGEFERLAESFHDAHRRHFGFDDPDNAIELVALRVSVGARRDPRSDQRALTPPARTERSTRGASFGGRQLEAQVIRGALQQEAPGPALIEQPQATIVVPPGWNASPNGADVLLTRIGATA